MKKFLTDIFSEETEEGAGKFSAKRFMGITVGLLAGICSVITGFHFYDIPTGIINPMWYYSGAMLGVSILKRITK
jgi:hypothetical protein